MTPDPIVGFLFVFGFLAGLEVIDRTSFALVALATRLPPWPTWWGGSAAFVLTTGLSVLLGATFVSALGPDRLGLLRVGSGVFLIAYAFWAYTRTEDPRRPIDPGRPARSAFVTAFLTIFLLELGDDTMLFEIVFVATFGWLVVLAGGALALVVVAGWDVRLGRAVGARLSRETLRRIEVVALTSVGAATIAFGLAPGLFPTLSVAAGA